MNVSPVIYVRKPFTVQAVQVTEENLNDVADWCDGNVLTTAEQIPFIKVNVHKPLTSRQTRAFVGDWVLFAGKGFKVYTDAAFKASFELPPASETTTETKVTPLTAIPQQKEA